MMFKKAVLQKIMHDINKDINLKSDKRYQKEGQNSHLNILYSYCLIISVTFCYHLKKFISLMIITSIIFEDIKTITHHLFLL